MSDDSNMYKNQTVEYDYLIKFLALGLCYLFLHYFCVFSHNFLMYALFLIIKTQVIRVLVKPHSYFITRIIHSITSLFLLLALILKRNMLLTSHQQTDVLIEYTCSYGTQLVIR